MFGKLLQKIMKTAAPEVSQPLVDENGKPIPFVPRGEKRPFFFLHIPKTSGSSWNSALSEVYGGNNFIEHAEYQLAQLLKGTTPSNVSDGVSGHIPLNNWRRYPQTSAYGTLTVLRDPWARLVSHINWMDRFNHGKTLDAHGPQAEKIARVAKTINDTDFKNRASLVKFRDTFLGEGLYPAFDNLQVRMLYSGRKKQMLMPMDHTATDAALDALSGLDGFGFCENTEAFQSDVLTVLGHKPAQAMPHANQGPLRRVHVGLDLAREVLEPMFAYDLDLYQRAQTLSEQRIAKHGSMVLS